MKRQANEQISANMRKRANQNQHQNNVYNQQYTPPTYSANSPAQYEGLNPYNLMFNGSSYSHPSGGWTAPIHPPPPLPKGPPPGSPYYNPTQPPPLPTTRHPDESKPPPPPSPTVSSNQTSYNSQNTWNRKYTQNNFDYKNNNFQDYTNQSYAPIQEPPVEPEKVIKVSKKSKRKPMSSRMNHKKEWNREDALKALELEQEFNQMQKLPMLILKFPDPDINKEIVKKYSKSIANVHFQQPSTARYCFVQLRPDADIEKVKAEISSTPFGTGFIQCERKNPREDEEDLPIEELDPYTLYIGNLPTNISVAAVKLKFPTAHRIDIGYAQRMKNTRYAFVRYEAIDDAIKAYRETYNVIIESRTIIVRFRRQKGGVNFAGEPKLFPPRIPLALKKSSDLLEAPSEIDFMDDSFDHDEDLINHSADIEEIEPEEIEPEEIEDDSENIVNNKVNNENIEKNKEDTGQIVNNKENNENVENNQENTNRVNLTDTKQNIIKANEVVETTGITVIDSSLIKTEVKEEPKDDIETYDDIEEDDLEIDPNSSEDGEDDEEESEDGEDSDKSDDETTKAGNTTNDNGFYWDKLRLDEIAAQEADIKPDISKIKILTSDTINEIADKGLDRLLDKNLLKVKETEKVNEDEELAALYNSLNPDD